MTLSPAQISFIKSIGIVIVVSVLSYLGNEANLTGVMPTMVATLIAAAASSFEAHMREKTGSALFGAARER